MLPMANPAKPDRVPADHIVDLNKMVWAGREARQ
jgi:hypothetical protein